MTVPAGPDGVDAAGAGNVRPSDVQRPGAEEGVTQDGQTQLGPPPPGESGGAGGTETASLVPAAVPEHAPGTDADGGARAATTGTTTTGTTATGATATEATTATTDRTMPEAAAVGEAAATAQTAAEEATTTAATTATAATVAPASHGHLDARYVTLGAASIAGERLVGLVRSARITARLAGRPAELAVRLVVPPTTRHQLASAMQGLERRGRAEMSARSQNAVRRLEHLTSQAMSSPTTVRVLEEVVDQLHGTVLDTVLPATLDRLLADPEEVRTLILGPSRAAAVGVANIARTRAAEGDQTVETLLARILHRRQRDEPRHDSHSS